MSFRIFVASGLLAISHLACALTAEPVTVQRVLDGDTVELVGRPAHIRLANIDAPESSHGRGKAGQPFSKASGDFLRRQVMNDSTVTMVCIDRDTRYGRDVCELFKGGKSVNRMLVESGLAWANTSARGRYLHDKDLVTIQADARRRRLGIWSQDTASSPAIPPWQWRDECWKQGICLVVEE
jgi:micrococcal nuclease